MSVTADTSQVEIGPYVASAQAALEVHMLTAVWSSDLEVNSIITPQKAIEHSEP